MIRMVETNKCRNCYEEIVQMVGHVYPVEVMTKKQHSFTRCYELIKAKGLTPNEFILKRVQKEENKSILSEAFSLETTEKNAFICYTNGYLWFLIHKGKKLEIGIYDDDFIIVFHEGMREYIRNLINTPKIVKEKQFQSQIDKMDTYWKNIK